MAKHSKRRNKSGNPPASSNSQPLGTPPGPEGPSGSIRDSNPGSRPESTDDKLVSWQRHLYGILVEQGMDPNAAEEIVNEEMNPEIQRPTRVVRELGEQNQVAAFEKWLRSLEEEGSRDS